MFAGLHIEKAAMKLLGNWVKDSGWAEALQQANIVSHERADSVLKAAHVYCIRGAHQVTVPALNILLHCIYNKYCQITQGKVHMTLTSSVQNTYLSSSILCIVHNIKLLVFGLCVIIA